MYVYVLHITMSRGMDMRQRQIRILLISRIHLELSQSRAV